MRTLGSKEEKIEVLDSRMTHRGLDKELTETLTSIVLVDEHVAEPAEGRSVSHPPSYANLHFVWIKTSKSD